jgi:MFS family permease
MRVSFLNLLIWGLSTFFAVWMLQKFWESRAVSVAWFGALWASGNIVAAITSKYAARLQVHFGSRPTILFACALPLVAYFGMALIPGTAAVVLGLGFYFGRGLIQVLMREEFNHHLPNEFRATANSVQSFFFRMTFAVFGPVVGWLIDAQGVSIALLWVGAIFLAFYLWQIARLCRS